MFRSLVVLGLILGILSAALDVEVKELLYLTRVAVAKAIMNEDTSEEAEEIVEVASPLKDALWSLAERAADEVMKEDRGDSVEVEEGLPWPLEAVAEKIAGVIEPEDSY